MKSDELAFVNRQLAGMLRDGLPLEGALRGTAREMASGQLRDELEALEKDLATGTPLAEAILRREFPPVYRALVRVGAASGDLPGALVAAADHFESAAMLAHRMQAVAVYPACVLAVMVVVSSAIGWLVSVVGRPGLEDWGGDIPPGLLVLPWVVPGLLVVVGLAVLAFRLSPGWRGALSWRIPMLRDARVAAAAETLAVLVRQGCPFPDSVALLRKLEKGTPLSAELARWQQRMAGGASRFSEIASAADGSTVFPPLFRWLVSQSGSGLADGLAAAGKFYGQRARHRIDLVLHGALPVATVLLGLVVIVQFVPLIRWVISPDGGIFSGEGN